jgi:hypothetical protein
MSTPITGALGGPAEPFPSIPRPTAGMVAANCLIASGGHLAIPKLNGIPAKYQMAFGIQPAAKLGRTLLEAGLADCNDWRQSGKKPVEGHLLMPVKAESGFGSALAILKKPRLRGALAAVAFTIVLS